MGLDKRIGSKFLHPGPGYGGSCFPKDTRALAALGSSHGVAQRIVTAAIEVNRRQRELLVEKIERAVGGTLAGCQIAMLGLAFKPNTDDVRESPALYACRRLVDAGARVRAFDPVASQAAAAALGDAMRQVTLAADAYDAVCGADVAVIMTEWNEFRGLDLRRIAASMRCAVIVDARNVLDPAETRALGFAYFCTGREHEGTSEPVLA